MFDGLNKIILTVLISLILGLTACLWYQSWRNERLLTENNAQAELIAQQKKATARLLADYEREKQAVISQQKIASELRTQLENRRETVRTIIQKEPCAVTALPHSVIKQLQK